VVIGIVLGVVFLVAIILAARAIRIVPQARAAVVERFGRYNRTLEPGLTFISPFIDRVRPMIDLREQVVNFAPQSVITQDNVVVAIETVLYFTITDPRAASYEVASPLQAIEQLTMTTLRNVIGGLTLEQTLTSREGVNTELRTVLDEATGKWGIRINRVEIKSVDPPGDIKAAMEKQMRAERDRRAAILTAEGTKQAAILTAEGEQRSAILTAEGERQAAILRAEGEAKAIATVFDAIHAGDADHKLLSYQYLQMLPQLAQGDANTVFVIPSEFTQAFAGIADRLAPPGGRRPGAGGDGAPPELPSGGGGEGAQTTAAEALAGGSDTSVEELLRDSPLADASATAGVQSSVAEVLGSVGADASVAGEPEASPADRSSPEPRTGEEASGNGAAGGEAPARAEGT